MSSNLHTYLAETSSKYDNLVQLSHLLQKVVDARSLDDINVMPLPLYLHRDDVIRLRDKLHDQKLRTKDDMLALIPREDEKRNIKTFELKHVP